MKKVFLSALMVLFLSGAAQAEGILGGLLDGVYVGGGGIYSGKSDSQLLNGNDVETTRYGYFGKAGFRMNNWFSSEVEYNKSLSKVRLLDAGMVSKDFHEAFYVNGIVMIPKEYLFGFPIRPLGFVGVDLLSGRTQWGVGGELPLGDFALKVFYRHPEEGADGVNAEVKFYF